MFHVENNGGYQLRIMHCRWYVPLLAVFTVIAAEEPTVNEWASIISSLMAIHSLLWCGLLDIIIICHGLSRSNKTHVDLFQDSALAPLNLKKYFDMESSA